MQKLCEMHAYIFLGDGIPQFMFFCMWVIFSETIWWLLLPFCHNRKGVWHIQTRQNTFLSAIEGNIFHSLYDVKDYAHKNHNLVLQWDGKSQDYSLERNDNLLQLLIDNLTSKSHSWAIKELKRVFGTIRVCPRKSSSTWGNGKRGF